jgi:fucose permease
MFTKVVSHGLRRVRGKSTGVVLHAVVGGAIVATAAALVATFIGSHGWCLHILAWTGIVIAAVGLIFDIVAEERSERESTEDPPPNGSPTDSTTAPRSST